jgi:uncharacterized protein involved in outer membrane biogenesis
MVAVHEYRKPELVPKPVKTGVQRVGDRIRHFLFESEWTALRIMRWTAALVVALLAAAVVWLYFLDWNTMRGPVSRWASARLGRPVQITGNLSVHLFSLEPRVSASGVTVANPDWAQGSQAAQLPHLAFTFRLIPALFGDAVLPLVQLDRPDIRIVRLADGRTNWDFGGGNTGWNLPPIQRFLVREGHIRIDDRIRNLQFAGTVTSEETAGAGGAAFRLTGAGTLNRNMFSAEVKGGPLIHVDQNKPYSFVADVHAGATHAVADGAIVHPFHLGQFYAALTLTGPSLAELYPLTGLVMPHTAAYRMHGTLTRDGSLYQFKEFAGTVGDSDLRGTLAIETAGARPMVRGKVVSRVLDFKDIGNLFGTKSERAVVADKLLPDVPLHVERLRQMDASVDYDAATIRSRDFPMRGAHTHVDLRGAVLTLQPLAFQFAYGRLSGMLKIDARKPVAVTDVDARITDVKVEQFLGANPAATGMLEARARLSGSGNSVHQVASTAAGPVTLVVPRGQFSAKIAEYTGINLLNALFVGDRERTQLRCAVAHFDTRGGVMRAQSFVFDTEPVRIEGKGTIDLQHETLDLTVVGKPKEFRIGRLHAPITVTGAWAHPDTGIKPGGIIAQGGAAVLLGLLFPPAAILPFVDPGLAKDANCSGLLTQASAGGAPVPRRHR